MSLVTTAWQRHLEDFRRGLLEDDTPPQVEPDEPDGLTTRALATRVQPNLKWFNHSIILCSVLDRIMEGTLRRVMIVMPPQYGKSTMAGKFFPATFLRRYPHLWVGLASYGASLASIRGRDARDAFVADGGRLRPGAEAASGWETEHGGGMWTAGIGGSATGKPASLLIVDDPVKNHEEAASPPIQQRNRDWYGSTWLARESRFSDRPLSQLHIQTRWNMRDLGGHVIELGKNDPEPWHVVHFPHIMETIPRDLYPKHWTIEPDWRKPGEVLCPELASKESVESTRRNRGAYFWAAIDQGWPKPSEGGGVFRDFWFETLPVKPDACDFEDLVRSWDVAATPNGGDATCGVLMGRTKDGVVVIIDVVEVHEGAVNVKALQLSVADADKKWVALSMRHGSCMNLTPQDPAAAGKADGEATRRLLTKKGHKCELYRPSGSKRVRARPMSSAAQPIEANGEVVSLGRVKIAPAPWNERVLGQLHSFTGESGGEGADLVDACSEGFNFLEGKPEKRDLTW